MPEPFPSRVQFIGKNLQKNRVFLINKGFPAGDCSSNVRQFNNNFEWTQEGYQNISEETEMVHHVFGFYCRATAQLENAILMG